MTFLIFLLLLSFINLLSPTFFYYHQKKVIPKILVFASGRQASSRATQLSEASWSWYSVCKPGPQPRLLLRRLVYFSFPTLFLLKRDRRFYCMKTYYFRIMKFPLRKSRSERIEPRMTKIFRKFHQAVSFLCPMIFPLPAWGGARGGVGGSQRKLEIWILLRPVHALQTRAG